MQQSPADPAPAGWLHGVAADIAFRADLRAAAADHFEAALELAPMVTTQAAYADLLIAMGNLADTLRLTGQQPTAPSLVLRELPAKAQLGMTAPERIEKVDAQFRAFGTDDCSGMVRLLDLPRCRVVGTARLRCGCSCGCGCVCTLSHFACCRADRIAISGR
jgi:hypothetical protein